MRFYRSTTRRGPNGTSYTRGSSHGLLWELFAPILAPFFVIGLVIGVAQTMTWQNAVAICIGPVLIFLVLVWAYAKTKLNERRSVPKSHGVLRCEKNGHLMEAGRVTCPIDGSRVRAAAR